VPSVANEKFYLICISSGGNLHENITPLPFCISHSNISLDLRFAANHKIPQNMQMRQRFQPTTQQPIRVDQLLYNNTFFQSSVSSGARSSSASVSSTQLSKSGRNLARSAGTSNTSSTTATENVRSSTYRCSVPMASFRGMRSSILLGWSVYFAQFIDYLKT
jgi:hypothetical protein